MYRIEHPLHSPISRAYSTYPGILSYTTPLSTRMKLSEKGWMMDSSSHH